MIDTAIGMEDMHSAQMRTDTQILLEILSTVSRIEGRLAGGGSSGGSAMLGGTPMANTSYNSPNLDYNGYVGFDYSGAIS